MTTLLAVYNSEGCIGRCDASCYDAKGPVCTCCCGGMNHGKGRQQASENTHELAEAMVMEWAKDHADGDDVHWKVAAKEPLQLALV